MRIVIDADYLAYAAASVCESRSVICKHDPSGKTKTFKNRTEVKSWVSRLNKEREEKGLSAFEMKEFSFEDVQTPDEVKFGFRVIDAKIKDILNKCRYNEFTDTFELYLGAGETFRHKLSRLAEYKGSRKNLIKPLALPQMRKYMQNKYKASIILEREADDEVNLLGVEGYLQWKESQDDEQKVVVVSIDKDALSGPMFLLNPEKESEPRLIEGFGSLRVDEKGKIKGEGRKWLGFQILYGDDIDGYRSTVCADVKFGPKGAYNILNPCQTDKEMWEAIVKQYKTWYPRQFQFKGWRGDMLTLTWLDVLQEIASLATMMTSADMEFDIKKILNNYGVKY